MTEERLHRRVAKFARMDRRFALIMDVRGPKVRLGVVWFVALVICSALGRFSVAALFSVVAVVAALQIAAHLMDRGGPPQPTRRRRDGRF